MKFQYTKHRKMWDYIAKNLEDHIEEYCDVDPENIFINIKNENDPEDVLIEVKKKFLGNENIINGCYACDYVYKEHKSLTDCSKCPLVIGNCTYEDSLYDNLLKSIEFFDISDAIHYCTKIRDAKVKDGVEWE